MNIINKFKLAYIITNMNKKQIIDLQTENKNLKEIAHEQKREIENLKFQLENVYQINKEYESIIDSYKKNENKTEENTIKSQSEQDEIAKLNQQLESWKKEYFDLLEKTMNGTTNITNDILNYKKYNQKDDNNSLILQTSLNNFNDNSLRKSSIKTVERPQTAQGRKYQADDFERVLQGIKIMRQKNLLDDSLDNGDEDNVNEEESEEESEEEDEQIKINENNINKDNILKQKLNNSGILPCPVKITKGMFPKTGSESSLAPIKKANAFYKNTSNH